MKELLSSTEVGILLGRSLHAISNYLRKGQIKGIKVGRSWVIPREEFERIKNLEIDRRKIGAINGRWE